MTRTTPAKTISAREAAALVRSGDWLDFGAVLAQPDVFDQALAERAGELRNVNIRGCLSVRPRARSATTTAASSTRPTCW